MKAKKLNIRVWNAQEHTEGASHVLRVTYSTDEDDELTEDLPMEFFPDNFEDGLPAHWNVVDWKLLTPFQQQVWDAYGDAAANYEEEKNER